MHCGATAGNQPGLGTTLNLLSVIKQRDFSCAVYAYLDRTKRSAKPETTDCEWLPLATGSATAIFSTPTEIAVNQCSMLIDNHMRVLCELRF